MSIGKLFQIIAVPLPRSVKASPFTATAGASPTVTGWHDYSFVTKVGSKSNLPATNDTVTDP
jgi:hypothetical protein